MPISDERQYRRQHYIAQWMAIALLFFCYAPHANAAKPKITFYHDIQPLLFANCTSCHRPGQSAPFPLITYNDAVKHAQMMSSVTHSGYMPPWKADTAYRKFTDQRTLTQSDIDLLDLWIAGGMEVGDAADSIAMPFFNTHSNLGKPDLTLTAPEMYTVAGDNKDTFIYFVMHYTLPSDTNVLAFEFVPGNPLAVHHSNTWVFPEPSEYDRFYNKRQPDLMTIENLPSIEDYVAAVVTPQPPPPPRMPGYPDFFPTVMPLYYDGWVPGATARTWPEGFGFRMPDKGVVIMQIHYGPTPVERQDQSYVNIFFTDKKVERMIESFNIGSSGGIAEPEPELIIPADSVKKFEITADVAKDLSYIALNPHMHYLGREMKAFAITPEKDTIQLIWIKKWDFRWQEFYKPLSLIKIPKGSVIKVLATYDNTADNPDNQFSPPRDVAAGARSADEMMSLIVMSVTYREGDEQIKLRADQPTVSRRPPKKK